jgi:hypothetical protein
MATLTTARKTGGRTVARKRKTSGGKGLDIQARLRGLLGALKTSLVPLALAVIAVGVATRWAKRDDKTGKPTLMFPFIASAIAWLVPELLMQGLGRRGFGGLVTTSGLRMAGAFAFLLALTFDEMLGPVYRSALQGGKQAGNFVGRMLVWAGDLVGGGEASRRFVLGGNGAGYSPAPPPAAPPHSEPGSYDQADHFSVSMPDPGGATHSTQPVAQQPAAPQQQPAQMSDTAAIMQGVFGFLGQAAQAAPAIIGQFQSTNPGEGTGLAGAGDPYQRLARRAA